MPERFRPGMIYDPEQRRWVPGPTPIEPEPQPMGLPDLYKLLWEKLAKPAGKALWEAGPFHGIGAREQEVPPATEWQRGYTTREEPSPSAEVPAVGREIPREQEEPVPEPTIPPPGLPPGPPPSREQRLTSEGYEEFAPGQFFKGKKLGGGGFVSVTPSPLAQSIADMQRRKLEVASKEAGMSTAERSRAEAAGNIAIVEAKERAEEQSDARRAQRAREATIARLGADRGVYVQRKVVEALAQIGPGLDDKLKAFPEEQKAQQRAAIMAEAARRAKEAAEKDWDDAYYTELSLGRSWQFTSPQYGR